MIGVQVKYHNPDQPRIACREGSDWVDLHAAKVWRPVVYCDGTREHVELSLDRTVPFQDGPAGWHLMGGVDYLIGLGVSMHFPDMFEAHLIPRSSTYKHYGLVMTNSMGLIDHTYCGNNDEWLMPCRCHSSSYLPLYARVAQFRLMWRMPTIAFTETDNLPRANRGGYGSTGR